MKLYGKWVGISFLVSAIFLTIVVVNWIGRSIKNKWYDVKYKKTVLNHLKNLDRLEQSFVREFIFGSASCALPFTNPTVAGLVNKGIIYQVGSHGDMKYGELCLNYSLSKLAREQLTFDMLGMPNLIPDKITSEEKRFLENNRPDFLKKYRGWI